MKKINTIIKSDTAPVTGDEALWVDTSGGDNSIKLKVKGEGGEYTQVFTAEGMDISDLEDKIQENKDSIVDLTATLAAKENVANKVTSINADADDVHYPSAKAVKDSLAKVKNIEVTPDMLSESTKQFINASGGGTITNFADDEDLTTVDNALKLADKAYDPITYSGMGRKYLRKNLVDGKNILTQAMIPSANTIYIIQYDYDLNGATITIPENCTLDFQGGSLGNGVLQLNDTYINGSAHCLAGITKITGTNSNNINFSWLGIAGKNPDNAAKLKNLANYSCKEYIVDSNVYIDGGDIEFPKNVTINGFGHNLYFSCDTAENACIILADGDVFNDISINNTSKDYAMPIVLAKSEINQIHSFNFTNVKITGQWNSEKQYLSTALKIQCSNEAEIENNYISNCNLNNITIQWVNVGINVELANYEQSNGQFAWMNEIHISNIYISAKSCGLYTYFTEKATANKTNSAGPIYLSNYEFQSLVGEALMFSHYGDWRLIINTGFSYDNTYKGEIRGGTVVTTNVLGCYQKDTSGDYADYKVTDSVKIYSGKLLKNTNELATMATFRQGNYDHASGTQYWNAGVEGTSFVIKDAQSFLGEKMFRRANHMFSKAYMFSGLQYNQNYTKNSAGGLKTYIAAPNYAINHNDQVVLALGRTSMNTTICNSYGMTEVYNGGLSRLINEGNIVFIKINLKFKIDGSVVSYGAAKTHFGVSTIKTMVAPCVSIYGFSIMENYYRVIDDELYIYAIAKKVDPTGYVSYSFSVTYERSFYKDKWHTESNGEVVIDALDDSYFISGYTFEIIGDYPTRGATSNRPTPDAVFTTFQYFDTTLNKPIWWTGSAWVDATGATV